LIALLVISLISDGNDLINYKIYIEKYVYKH
jgi:hypothetical protein